MPPSLAIGAFVLGGVLLLISVVGGGFKLFGAEVSGSAGRSGRFVAFVAGVVLIITGLLRDRPEHSDPGVVQTAGAPMAQPATTVPALESVRLPQPSTQLAKRDTSPIVRQSAQNAEPAVRVEWRGALQELMAMAASLTDAEKMALGYNVMLTGQDVYGVYVRITNVGSVPIDVSPDDLRLTYNGAPVPLMRADDRRFLQPVRLAPDRHVEGILTFNAPIVLGGAVLANGRLSYQGAGVQVTYR